MYMYDDIDSMLKYIHEAIKHDCERHIMLNRVSLGLPPYPIDNMRGIMLTDMSNHSKPNLDDVIWWNYQLFSYAVGKMKEYKIGEYFELDTDWDLLSTLCRLYYLDQGEDVSIWGQTLRHFGRNFTEGLKISKWNVSYVTKEMCPNMSDDEIKYMNHMWNNIFNDKPYTSDFNNNKPKNSWLERKTKRSK